MTEPEAAKPGFPVVSVGVDDTGERLAGIRVGEMDVSEEILYGPAGSGTEPDYDDERGAVVLIHWKAQGRIPYTAYFAFSNGGGQEPDLVVASGIVPGNGSWRGRTTATLSGGTGRFVNASGSIPVLSENPKRWG